MLGEEQEPHLGLPRCSPGTGAFAQVSPGDFSAITLPPPLPAPCKPPGTQEDPHGHPLSPSPPLISTSRLLSLFCCWRQDQPPLLTLPVPFGVPEPSSISPRPPRALCRTRCPSPPGASPPLPPAPRGTGTGAAPQAWSGAPSAAGNRARRGPRSCGEVVGGRPPTPRGVSTPLAPSPRFSPPFPAGDAGGAPAGACLPLGFLRATQRDLAPQGKEEQRGCAPRFFLKGFLFSFLFFFFFHALRERCSAAGAACPGW